MAYVELEKARELLFKLRNECIDFGVKEDTVRGVLYSINELAKLPTADVEEVKHGEWELKSEIRRYLEEIDEDFYVECPFCNRVYYVPFEFEDEKMLEYAKKNYPYCNCGAKMDGGKVE